MPLEPSYQRALEALADRLAQYAAGSASDASRLEQARALFRLAGGLDITYLSRRIGDEGGDPTLLPRQGSRRFRDMITIRLEDLLDRIDARKKALGMTEKRELLRRMERRAIAAGVTPIPAHY